MVSRVALFRRPRQHARTHAAIPPTSLKPTYSIYVSNSTNPYFNLTFEDWLFRFHPPNAPLLLLYRDSPCVVIGRNQNPWKEVNLVASEARDIPWIRRRSGGGTVYHDLGNTNYSIHVPRTTFDRTATANIIVRAVRALGVDASVNERNDICVAGEKMSSAYKIVNNRAYHHGTMLISTRLDTLGDLLRTNKETMRTKGVASVRSPVRNLVQSSASVTHEAFVDAVIQSFREEYAIDEEPCFVHETSQYLEDEYFNVGMSELQASPPSRAWCCSLMRSFRAGIGRMAKPPSLNMSSTTRSSGDSCTRSELDRLSQRLVGKRYAFVDDNGEKTEGIGEIWSWLKREMCV
ncbi:hypothetical protein J3R83DRAFT_1139 [Lanmaoa asiatica]|nr:hypothetical protein J3R83DRAFT_1139 [Lanmaoa asiatica]